MQLIRSRMLRGPHVAGPPAPGRWIGEWIANEMRQRLAQRRRRDAGDGFLVPAGSIRHITSAWAWHVHAARFVRSAQVISCPAKSPVEWEDIIRRLKPV